MKIDCISDLHGFLPQLDGGDLLIIAGDITASDQLYQYEEFFQWLQFQKYKTIIYIAGNHDGIIGKKMIDFHTLNDIRYLEDSYTYVNDFKIWGSPWTPTFLDWHFMKERGEPIKEKWDLIPDDIDILITHGPPYGILDKVKISSRGDKFKKAGCMDLMNTIPRLKNLKLHVFGHIHESYGILEIGNTKFVNACIMNENYEPINKPISVIL